MSESTSNQPSPFGDDLLDQLDLQSIKEDISSIIEDQIEIPSTFDDDILNRAQTHFAGMNEKKNRYLFSNHSLKWLTAAACIVIVSFVAIRLGVLKSDQPALAGDIDRSGNIDILDAFTLARYIEAKTTLKDEWDVNADGSVNASDVQFIAKQTVSITETLTASFFDEIEDNEQFAILLEGIDS